MATAVAVVEIINSKFGAAKSRGSACAICLPSWCPSICAWSTWEFVFVANGAVVLNCIMDTRLSFPSSYTFGVSSTLVNSQRAD